MCRHTYSVFVGQDQPPELPCEQGCGLTWAQYDAQQKERIRMSEQQVTCWHRFGVYRPGTPPEEVVCRKGCGLTWVQYKSQLHVRAAPGNVAAPGPVPLPASSAEAGVPQVLLTDDDLTGQLMDRLASLRDEVARLKESNEAVVSQVEDTRKLQHEKEQLLERLRVSEEESEKRYRETVRLHGLVSVREAEYDEVKEKLKEELKGTWDALRSLTTVFRFVSGHDRSGADHAKQAAYAERTVAHLREQVKKWASEARAYEKLCAAYVAQHERGTV